MIHEPQLSSWFLRPGSKNCKNEFLSPLKRQYWDVLTVLSMNVKFQGETLRGHSVNVVICPSWHLVRWWNLLHTEPRLKWWQATSRERRTRTWTPCRSQSCQEKVPPTLGRLRQNEWCFVCILTILTENRRFRRISESFRTHFWSPPG